MESFLQESSLRVAKSSNTFLLNHLPHISLRPYVEPAPPGSRLGSFTQVFQKITSLQSVGISIRETEASLLWGQA